MNVNKLKGNLVNSWIVPSKGVSDSTETANTLGC